MKVFLAAILFVGLCVLGLGFNIFFRKDGHFPDTEISTNPNMKKLGIKCVKEEEMQMLSAQKGKKQCSGNYSDACSGCSFYTFEKRK